MLVNIYDTSKNSGEVGTQMWQYTLSYQDEWTNSSQHVTDARKRIDS
jgi:hypothetical protein